MQTNVKMLDQVVRYETTHSSKNGGVKNGDLENWKWFGVFWNATESYHRWSLLLGISFSSGYSQEYLFYTMQYVFQLYFKIKSRCVCSDTLLDVTPLTLADTRMAVLKRQVASPLSSHPTPILFTLYSERSIPLPTGYEDSWF